MKKQSKKILGLFSRYLIILLMGMGNLYIIYKILTPLTIYSVNMILSIFVNTIVVKNIIFTGGIVIEIIPACVAGSAFYLLFLLVLSTADINPKKRSTALLSTFGIFFILNVIRILILIPLANNSSFEIVHWIFWHVISTLFVILVWFSIIKLYKIKSIPIYSDFKYMKSLIKSTKNSKRKKKYK